MGEKVEHSLEDMGDEGKSRNRPRDGQPFRTFEGLDCWKACRELRLFAADACKRLPREEAFRLKDQILRSGRRTTAGIAEGYGRYHYQENIQYCRASRGSVYELLDHFITAVDEGILEKRCLVVCREKAETAAKLINGYIRYLQKRKNEDNSQSQ